MSRLLCTIFLHELGNYLGDVRMRNLSESKIENLYQTLIQVLFRKTICNQSEKLNLIL